MYVGRDAALPNEGAEKPTCVPENLRILLANEALVHHSLDGAAVCMSATDKNKWFCVQRAQRTDAQSARLLTYSPDMALEH